MKKRASKIKKKPKKADDDEESWWARVASLGAGPEAGFYLLPEV